MKNGRCAGKKTFNSVSKQYVIHLLHFILYCLFYRYLRIIINSVRLCQIRTYIYTLMFLMSILCALSGIFVVF